MFSPSVSPPITSAEEITPERVAAFVGCHPDQIESVVVQPGPESLFALHHRVAITYRTGMGDLPRALLVKRNPPTTPAFAANRGGLEVRFYTEVVPCLGRFKALPVPRCYNVGFRLASGNWHLVLEDLSQSHTPAETLLPHTDEQCREAIRTLAATHGALWDLPELECVADFPEPRPPAEELRRRFKRTLTNLGPFLEGLGDSLSPGQKAQFERLANQLPEIWATRFAQRPEGHPGFTLVHGETHPWNFHFPREAGSQGTLLGNWQTYRAGTPATDLTCVMVLNWGPEQRGRMEAELVRLWHSHLLEAGVTEYDWEDCWMDYLRAAALMFYAPVRYWMSGVPQTVWHPWLENLLAAHDDLNLEQLLA